MPSGDTALKTLCVNTVSHAIHKCRLQLYHAKKQRYVKMPQKHCCILYLL